METLYVVMPAYNEGKTIERVVREWYPVVQNMHEGSRLVVADAGSTDATHEILLKLKQDFSQLEILSDTKKQHGPKLIALYEHAISGGGRLDISDGFRWADHSG